MSRTLLMLAVAALAVAAAAPSCAARPRGLTDEQRAALEERWLAADTDGDGLIDRAEADAGLPRIAQRFDMLDRNGDGKLSRDELREAAQEAARRRRR